MQVEADHRRGRILVGVEFIDVERIDRKDIPCSLQEAKILG
jgi:hypothetical protein